MSYIVSSDTIIDNMSFIFVQSLAIIASIFFAISFHARSKNRILMRQLISLLIWGAHFLFLSAWTGLAVMGVNMVVTVVFLFKEQHEWAKKIYILYLSIIVLAIVTFITWTGFYSIFGFLGVGSIILAKWQNDPRQIRLISIFASVFWIIYDLFVGSYGGIISECAFIISIIISLIRNKNQSGTERAQ